MTTITLSIDLLTLVAEAVAEAARAHAASLPQPDPQYTVPQVAEIHNLDKDTIRRYLRLETGHPRRLRYVDATGTSHGWRIPLSEITAWQTRNLARRPDELRTVLVHPARRGGR